VLGINSKRGHSVHWVGLKITVLGDDRGFAEIGVHVGILRILLKPQSACPSLCVICNAGLGVDAATGATLRKSRDDVFSRADTNPLRQKTEPFSQAFTRLPQTVHSRSVLWSP